MNVADAFYVYLHIVDRTMHVFPHVQKYFAAVYILPLFLLLHDIHLEVSCKTVYTQAGRHIWTQTNRGRFLDLPRSETIALYLLCV